MADIDLIVKIDVDVYTRLFDNGIQDNEIATDDICEMARALRLGTPLEKHDAEVIKETVVWGKPPYIEHIDKLIDKCMETLFDATLDKIRAEIEFLANSMAGHTGMVCAEDVFAIIDKYKGESEE